jgi:hypothetical protein
VTIPRELIDQLVGNNPRLRAAMEQVFNTSDVVQSQLAANVEATDAMDAATVITLSSNTAFKNERVLKLGAGLKATDTGAELQLDATGPALTGGFPVTLQAFGASNIALPLGGVLATVSNVETLRNKTLNAPKLSGLGDYADDTAAAAGSVPVGGMYRTGSALKVRVS